MRRTRQTLAWIGVGLALAVGLAGCAGSRVTVTEGDAGTIQRVRVGDTLAVRLGGNPSTGFNWSRTSPSDDAIADSVLAPVSEGEWVFPAGGNLPGEPGICIFVYEVARTGTVTLSYTYARSWEPEPAETWSITVWARD